MEKGYAWSKCMQLMNGYMIAIIVSAVMYSCAPQRNYTNPVVVIETKHGNIQVELYPEKAPLTVAGFLRNIDSGYYSNSSFYRVLRKDNQVTGSPHSYLIQGGIWQSNPDLKEKLTPIPHEPTSQTGILHTRGVISFARYGPGTATSEFFICIEDEPGFDFGGNNNVDGQGYATFGRVIEGMETADKIYRLPEHQQRFYPPVTILNIRRLPQEVKAQ